jgi:hypothetical protein
MDALVPGLRHLHGLLWRGVPATLQPG